MKQPVCLVLLVAMLGSGCANFESISRRSSLPANSEESGTAIHLDAKQRLVFAKGEHVCAEPSPDALSAVAASLGVSGGAPGKGAASLASALTTSAASIGLRTQSITLMRDALYRVCEAYYSGQLSEPQVMLLLARSQDLTATVVAVEQLTGAIVAQQAILSGSANAQAAASMVSSAEALERIQELSKRNQEQLNDATRRRDKAKSELETLVTERGKLQSERNKAEEDAEKAAIQSQIESKDRAIKEKETELQTRENSVELAEKQLAETRRVELEVAKQLDSALASSAAAASGSGQFGSNNTRDRLNDASTEQIAKTVETIVTGTLQKKYIREACIAVATQEFDKIFKTNTNLEIYQSLVFQCLTLLQRDVEREISGVASVTQSQNLVGALLKKIQTLPDDRAITLIKKPPVALTSLVQEAIEARDPQNLREQNGDTARQLLQQMVVLGNKDEMTLVAWRSALM